ncbi:MAG: hypothetical protein QM639_07130, partial [Rhodocyclaceae bacterium]
YLATRPGVVSSVAISGSRVLPGNATAVTNAYAFFRSALPNVPFGLMNRYAGGNSSGALIARQPDAENPNGAMLECPDDTLTAACTPYRSSALTLGIITGVDVPAVATPPVAMLAVTPAPALPVVAPAPVPASAVTLRAVAGTAASVAAARPTTVALLLMRGPGQNGALATGPSGPVFGKDDQIYVYVAFVQTPGEHSFETRWYKGVELIHCSAKARTGGTVDTGDASYLVAASTFGSGDFRLEYVLDGAVVGSKTFSIR